MDKTYNNEINGNHTSLYGSCVTYKENVFISNMFLLSDYICYYFDLIGANQSKINGIREYSRTDIQGILERLYNCSTYNCVNTPLFSAMLEVAYEINDKKAISKLENTVLAFEKQGIVEPKTISVLRDYYEREFDY